jgi:capsular polysaccharide export protein
MKVRAGMPLHPEKREEQFDYLPARLYAFNFPRWKWPIVRQCFHGHRLIFVRDARAVPAGACLLLWGMAAIPEGIADDVSVLRLEDGFLRSVGLGADLVRPLSWVVDRTGLYYDASRPSDLETILSTHEFDASFCARAARLRSRIVESGLTKYNVGLRSWQRPSGSGKVLLVPGQVESDASLAYGAPGERTNMGLLRLVRQSFPQAYLVYKPHPDVLARLRLEGSGEQEAHRWCDEVVTDVAMGDLLANVDEVHVLTSLAGFEAILRNKPVTCYGQPFYSGWGLTQDMLPIARRTRQLSLDQLVAGTLIEYPLYLSRDGRHLLTPEEALEHLVAWRTDTGGKEPWWRGGFRVILRRVAGVR